MSPGIPSGTAAAAGLSRDLPADLPAELRAMATSAREVLMDHWRAPGFTCPNATTYPWLWLWDSCFHSIVWAELGDAARATSELTTALSGQDASGFVPHLLYLDGFDGHDEFWGHPRAVPGSRSVRTSSITQPPIYGYTVAELVRRGIAVDADTIERSTAGLRFLLERRRRSTAGLVELVHPWESGCDHSPRWDDLMSPASELMPSARPVPPDEPTIRSAARRHDPYDDAMWFRRKGELLEGIQRTPGGAPVSNDDFAVGSVAFSAMVSFCASELASVTGDADLRRLAEEVRDALAERWEPGLRTWVDDGPTAQGSGRIRTAEALLPLLVEQRPEVIDAVATELSDAFAFGGAFGPAQVHRGEPRYRPGSYWRGPSWPQLDHLLWVGLVRAGRARDAALLAAATRRGAVTSGWAEYWDPDTAEGGGAAPQSWTTLALCMH